MRDYAQFLRTIAARVSEARLSTGARVLDTSDFREWLIELAEKAEQAETLEQFLSQV
jgi:saccharopine dehydrogenase-like NADP-dependent oxidoreductase